VRTQCSTRVCGRSVAEVVTGLKKKAELFAVYVKKNGLVMNAGKTQLMFSRRVSVGDVTVNVAGSAVSPSPTLSLLGVTFDWTLGWRHTAKWWRRPR
jgi:hypothetical protein